MPNTDIKMQKLTESSVDVSLVITFHNEGVLAHSTLNSIERCREHANNEGISTEYVWVLDSPDEETLRVIECHPAKKHNPTVVLVNHKDSGASRNAGIHAAKGVAIAILDGDDYFSKNWITCSWKYLSEHTNKVILHPEFVINFGAHAAYCWQIDQDGGFYNKNGLLTGNFWTVWTFALRDTYLRYPYPITYPTSTGFGYEDWQWNCETISAGYKHRLVPGTVGFYRRKAKSSLVETTTALGGLMPPTELFSHAQILKGLQ